MWKGGKTKSETQGRVAQGGIRKPQEFRWLKIEGGMEVAAWEPRKPRQDPQAPALCGPPKSGSIRPASPTVPGCLAKPPCPQNRGLKCRKDPNRGILLDTRLFRDALSIPPKPTGTFAAGPVLRHAGTCREALAFPAFSYLSLPLCKEFGAKKPVPGALPRLIPTVPTGHGGLVAHGVRSLGLHGNCLGLHVIAWDYMG